MDQITLLKMDEELDKFEKRIINKGEGKLIIDFSAIDLEFQRNQIDLGVIKYKKANKKLSKVIFKPKSKISPSQTLF